MINKDMQKNTTRQRNTKNVPIVESTQKVDKPILGIIDNMLWILANEDPSKNEQTLSIDGFDKPLSIEWTENRNAFLSDMLSGHNLLANGDFQGGDKHWTFNAESFTSAGINLSEDWYLSDGYTAYLMADNGALRPFMIHQKIKIVSDTPYRFSGFFATHRAGGLVTICCYDENYNLIDEILINVEYKTQYIGGKKLENYTLVESIFTPVNGTIFLQCKITLGGQVEFIEPNSYLFLSQLFLGVNTENPNCLMNTFSESAYSLSQLALESTARYFGKIKLSVLFNQKRLAFTLGDTPYQFDIDFSHQVQGISATQNVFHHSKLGVFAVDHCIAIESEGLLLYGWSYFFPNALKSIYVHGADSISDIGGSLFRTSRIDLLAEHNIQIFPDITEFGGLICYVPMQVNITQSYYVELAFNSGRSEWIKLTVSENKQKGVPLIKTLLNHIPAPDKIRPKLYDLFNQHLGKAINSINSNSVKHYNDIEERQFGMVVDNPSVSVIVPLYGRYDFMRHQLAHFVDDADFDVADLIYVVDDPSILIPTLDMAAACFELFEKPFRVIWYHQNLGFSGANNAGVRVANADVLLLLNSDVIPQQAGWLSTLNTALAELPNAGAVAPLLLFSDNSIQHAGMAPKADSLFPNFLLNIHPGKGMPWVKDDTPSRHPLLTAACLMVRKSDYLELDGLDEGYLIGDFEDSDFCLKLRKMGCNLWLVPEAKLWHLERQSQNLAKIAGHRHLITLYNGWRYHQKIVTGEIATPYLSEV
jgi:GT2 family glycosyltransferase